ncbi:OLC1v1015223C3 [Oldenlandia corymbosa var. corymbosa]|uniref:OLC1v1015223C3 n=1 Tax=Oldenlandia corymbosa var. corymbosa TaxID=529605 RepID=A0AAV1E2R0_OLDCO|nr:OLC1v1015223C3 [Oldenlandia corymbosa var. corymbosa]
MAGSYLSSVKIILLPILLLTLLNISSPAQVAAGAGGASSSALFIFGDSYFDPGNNNYINTTTLDQANFWPYGESYFNKPTGRFSNGRLISDFVAEYAGQELIPPFMEQPETGDFRRGANFASAGAGALVDTFRGSNIYQKGGRKFGFLNLGDLGCLPGLRVLHLESNGGGCLEAATLVAKLHNFELYKLLSKLEHQLEGFKYSLGDFNRALRQRIKHPSHFGLKEGRVACCGAGAFKGIFSCGGRRPMVENEFELCQNPQQHVFWDSYHLTEAVYGQMAAEMWNGSSFAGHYYLQALFNC